MSVFVIRGLNWFAKAPRGGFGFPSPPSPAGDRSGGPGRARSCSDDYFPCVTWPSTRRSDADSHSVGAHAAFAYGNTFRPPRHSPHCGRRGARQGDQYETQQRDRAPLTLGDSLARAERRDDASPCHRLRFADYCHIIAQRGIGAGLRPVHGGLRPEALARPRRRSWPTSRRRRWTAYPPTKPVAAMPVLGGEGKAPRITSLSSLRIGDWPAGQSLSYSFALGQAQRRNSRKALRELRAADFTAGVRSATQQIARSA